MRGNGQDFWGSCAVFDATAGDRLLGRSLGPSADETQAFAASIAIAAR